MTGLDPWMVRDQVRKCETLAEVRAWIAVYHQLDGQLPPSYDDLGAALNQQPPGRGVPADD